MTVAIDVYDNQLQRIGEIDDWQSLTVKKIWNDVGRWSLDLEAGTWGAGILDEAHRVYIKYNGKPLIAGPVDDPLRSFKDASNRLTISGPDDNIWIKSREAWPCAPNYTISNVFPDAANDVRSGNADDVIKQYVTANCLSSGWDPERVVPLLVVADPNGNGSNVTSSARFDMLFDIINAAALSGGDLGWAVTQQGRQLVFDTYVAQDLSATVKFSIGLGNLAEYSYEEQRPIANWVMVAGQGQGTERTFVTAQDEGSIGTWGRVEGPLVDRRDTDDPNVLAQSAADALSKGAGTLSISTTVNDTEGIQFGTHWGLGDKVSVIIDGETYTDVIREVDVTWQSADDPVSISPLIGSNGAQRPEVPSLFAKQRANAVRISQLEARV